jgi:uncharacterized membrane protein YphA (DoxX/SURF4 family)
VAEALFRVVLGLRFLSSGWSNVRRWPHATETAAIVSERAAVPFGAIATALMVLGGAGLALGLATPIAALLLLLFLIPTFKVHLYWLRFLPGEAAAVAAVIPGGPERSKFRLLQRHAIHAHETGWQENLVYLVACLYFLTHGSAGVSLDALIWSH